MGFPGKECRRLSCAHVCFVTEIREGLSIFQEGIITAAGSNVIYDEQVVHLPSTSQAISMLLDGFRACRPAPCFGRATYANRFLEKQAPRHLPIERWIQILLCSSLSRMPRSSLRNTFNILRWTPTLAADWLLQ